MRIVTGAGLVGLIMVGMLTTPNASSAFGEQPESYDSGQVTVTPGDQLGWHKPPQVRMDAEYGKSSTGSGTKSAGSRDMSAVGAKSSGSSGGSGPTCRVERLRNFAGHKDHPKTAKAMKQMFPDYYMGSRGGDETKIYNVFCSDGSGGWTVGDGSGTGGPGGAGGGGPAAVLPTPGELAERARQRLKLPLPTPGRSPRVRLADGRSATLVQENTWLWTDPGVWEERTERVQVGPVWAEVTAKPKSMRFTSGMGQAVTCDGPGTPYERSYGMHAASPDCGLRYTRASDAMPGGQTTAEYAITWSVSWRGSTGSSSEGGELPNMISRASESFVVAEAQSLRTS